MLFRSELSKVNETAYGSDVPVSDELYTVIDKALYYSEISGGCFDSSIGKLIDAWGIGTDHAGVPSGDTLKALSGKQGCRDIVLDPEKKTVRFLSEDVKLDLGAIAKGYIGDRTAALLKDEYGIESYLINLGGNVIAGSENAAKRRPWTIGIADPDNSSDYLLALMISDRTLVTSGTYERYFEKDGIRYHHILDPFTGYPADTGLDRKSVV